MTLASKKLAELYREKFMTDKPINKQLQAEIERFESLPSAPSEEEMGKIQKQIINLLDHLAEEHGTETFVSSGYGYYEDAADEFFALAVDLMSRTSRSYLQTEPTESLPLSDFDEDGWLALGDRCAQNSVDSGMDEKTAYMYGFMHGAREHREYVEANWPKVNQLIAEIETKQCVECNGKLDYYEAARVVHLYLDKFCDESLPYPDMISDAARQARERINELEADLKKCQSDWEKAATQNYADQERIKELEEEIDWRKEAYAKLDDVNIKIQSERDEARMKADELGDMIVQLKKRNQALAYANLDFKTKLAKATEALEQFTIDERGNPYYLQAKRVLKEIGSEG